MRRDVSWLAGQRLMDYSLLVAIKDHKETPTKGLPAGQPYVRQTSEGPIAVQMSIIDFLQRWTMGKRSLAESCFSEFLPSPWDGRITALLAPSKSLKGALAGPVGRNKATIPPRAYAARFAVHFTQHVVTAQEGARRAEGARR
ncbi:unnamed protein product, partial [Durusdinium trenchii]